jgi:hypothetical protein
MAATDSRALQLQISASSELLIRNLRTADNAVAEFRRKTDVNLTKIDTGFEKVGRSLAGFGGGAIAGLATSLVGAVSVGSLVALTEQAIDYASGLQEVSQQLGVTARDLQIYRYAATQVGISQEDIEKGLSKLTVTMGKAELGAKAPIAAFNAIGISIDELRGKTAGEALPLIADGLERIKDPAQRAALEVTLFGKAGQKLDTLLAGGSGQINELADAAEHLGLVLSDKDIAQADAVADKLSEVKQVLAANIAHAVADNSSAIFTFAEALEKAAIGGVHFLQKAGGALKIIRDEGLINEITNRKPGDTQLASTDRGYLALRKRKLDEALATYREVKRPENDDVSAAFGGLDRVNAEKHLREELRLTRKAHAEYKANQKEAAGFTATAKAQITKPDGGDAPAVFAPAAAKSRSKALKKPVEDATANILDDIRIDAARALQDYRPENADDAQRRRLSDLGIDTDPLGTLRDTGEAAHKRDIEVREQAEDQLREKQEQNIYYLSGLYEDLFSGSTGNLWDTFKRQGIRAVALVLAQLSAGKKLGGLGGIASTVLGSITGARASGGSVNSGSLYLVGEKGPELFAPGVGGNIIPNMPRLGNIAGGQQHVAVTADVNVHPAPQFYADVETITYRSIGAAADPIMAGAEARTRKAMGKIPLPGGYA